MSKALESMKMVSEIDCLTANGPLLCKKELVTAKNVVREACS